MKRTIYTIGSENTTFGQVVKKLRELRPKIFVDFRSKPENLQGEITPEKLQAECEANKTEYIRITEVDAILEKMGVNCRSWKKLSKHRALELIQLNNKMGRKKSSIVLFCAEKDPKKCCRKAMAEALAEYNAMETVIN